LHPLAVRVRRLKLEGERIYQGCGREFESRLPLDPFQPEVPKAMATPQREVGGCDGQYSN